MGETMARELTKSRRLNSYYILEVLRRFSDKNNPLKISEIINLINLNYYDIHGGLINLDKNTVTNNIIELIAAGEVEEAKDGKKVKFMSYYAKNSYFTDHEVSTLIEALELNKKQILGYEDLIEKIMRLSKSEKLAVS